MLRVGFDLGKRKSWAVIKEEDGSVVVDKKVATTADALSALFKGREKCLVLLEASTSSEWVARCLVDLGHEVIVADPNFQPMYAHVDKRIKTDRRDAHALWFALTVGAYRQAVRRSDEEMFIKATLSLRDQLVRNRSKVSNGVKATLQRFGIVGIDDTKPERLADAVRRDCRSERLREILEPGLRSLDSLTREVGKLDEMIAGEGAKHEIVQRLEKIPGVGTITALAFFHALSDVSRFDNADEVAAYLGLVPSIQASGEREVRGGITKRGDTVARALLNGAALTIMRSKDRSVQWLRDWALDLARRRGGKKKGGNAIARSALSRRLARIMYAMWRDGTDFSAERTAPLTTKEEAAAAE